MQSLAFFNGAYYIVNGPHDGLKHSGFVQHVGPGPHVRLVQVGGYGPQVVLPCHGRHVPVQAILHVTPPAPQGDHCDISYKGPGKVAGQPGLRMIEVWGSVIKDCGPYPG